MQSLPQKFGVIVKASTTLLGILGIMLRLTFSNMGDLWGGLGSKKIEILVEGRDM